MRPATNKLVPATAATDPVAGQATKSIVYARKVDRRVVISGRARLPFVLGVVLLHIMRRGRVLLGHVLGYLSLDVINRLVLPGIKCSVNVMALEISEGGYM